MVEQGPCTGKGRMDELRRFFADRAEAAGDRDKYLVLEFDQAADGLTLTSYKAFKKLCTKAEWTRFEPEMLSRMKNAAVVGAEMIWTQTGKKDSLSWDRKRWPMHCWSRPCGLTRSRI
jgi:hypothetical protein